MKKIEYSDFVATLALVVGGISLWYSISSAAPKISVRDMGPINIKYDAKPEILIAAFPMIITNHGARATALIQITRSNNPTVFRANLGAKFENEDSLELQYMILNEVYNSIDELADEIAQEEFGQLSFPQVLNMHLAAGASKTITMVVLIIGENGTSIINQQIAFDSNLLFADGTTYRMAAMYQPEE